MTSILSSKFVNQYVDREPPFTNWGLGELVYLRTYSRRKDDGNNEKWFETIERVVNGTFALKHNWFTEQKIEWNDEIENKNAEIMYDLMFNVKVLPGGRGLWAMGTKITERKHLYAALNNCAFVSTNDIDKTLSEPFEFLMDACMMGVGVGFDTKGTGLLTLHVPNTENTVIHKIEDSREGWVYALKLLLHSYFIANQNAVAFDYSGIRPMGTILEHFGGVSSGPEPLKHSFEKIRDILNKCDNKLITSRNIVDVMNLIGLCVVSGNIRRSASIALGESDDTTFINLKNYETNPERSEFGWLSNNSIFGELGMNYNEIAKNIQYNGEPGVIWLDNMRKYSRMNGIVDNRDINAVGVNPCCEQTLENHEMCCLVETFINRHNDMSDFLNTLKYAFMYAKTVTLGLTQWEKTNEVTKRNRRIGTSLTGITNFISERGTDELRKWCLTGYDFLKKWDETISKIYKIPQSIKITSIKPSGTISLLVPNTCSGMHYPESNNYIRRVRLSETSNLWKEMQNRGYDVEKSITEPNTMIVSFPVSLGNIKSVRDITMFEQLDLAALLQEIWSDNQVSCTVTFDMKTEGPKIADALSKYQYKLKGIAFLPLFTDDKKYPQMPYESITLETYNRMMSKINKKSASKDININDDDKTPEVFCTSDYCMKKQK